MSQTLIDLILEELLISEKLIAYSYLNRLIFLTQTRVIDTALILSVSD